MDIFPVTNPCRLDTYYLQCNHSANVIVHFVPDNHSFDIVVDFFNSR